MTSLKKVGLTIGMINDFKALESNSLLMNVSFLYDLLEQSKKYKPILVICDENNKIKPSENHKITYYDKEYDYHYLSEDTAQLDILLEVFYDFGIQHHTTLCTLNPNLKFIHISYGNSFIIDTCYWLYLEPRNNDINIENLNDMSNYNYNDTIYKDYNQIWISPHFMYSRDYYIAKYNIKEHQLYSACYLWDERIQQQRNKEIQFDISSIIYHKKKELNIGIFEANLHLIKTANIPIMIAEYLYNNYRNEVNIGKVYITNLHNMHQSEMFYKFIQSLNLYKDGKVHLSKNACRLPHFLKAYDINFVISHQIYNELNYLHFELFKLGIPFIHNCKMIDSFGYYYDHFEIIKAASKIIHINKYHNLNDKLYMDNYNNRCNAVLYRYSIRNKENLEKTEQYLDDLYK